MILKRKNFVNKKFISLTKLYDCKNLHPFLKKSTRKILLYRYLRVFPIHDCFCDNLRPDILR